MPTISAIRILEAEPNKKGDLFGRLMGDLFLALGYDQVRLNIHKSGREIDVDGQHRTEQRRVVAECKAEFNSKLLNKRKVLLHASQESKVRKRGQKPQNN